MLERIDLHGTVSRSATGVELVQGYLFGRPVPIAQLDLHATLVRKEMVA